MNLSDNLKRIRKEHNLSQEDLAEKLGVSRQSVSKWESGSAYPEMDKMLQLCKMFDLNIDELLNKDIKEVKDNKQYKNNINKYIDDFLSYMSKTINMFSSLKLGGKLKCIIEQCFIILFIYIVSLFIGEILSDVIHGLFSFLPQNAYNIIYSLLKSIYGLSVFVLGTIVLLHVFKTRYLDYYEVVDKVAETNESNEEETKESSTKKIERKDKKIIIRDPKDSRFGFINGLVKVILFFVKLFVIIIGIQGCISLVGLSIALAVSLLIIKSGFLFLGAFLAILSCIVINVDVLMLMYDFIINKKPKFMIMGLVFFISLVTLGFGIGLTTLWIKDVKFLKEYDNKYIIRVENEFDMNDSLSIIKEGLFEPEYIESDNSNIKIVYDHSILCDVNIENNDNILNVSNDCYGSDRKVYKEYMEAFKDKVIFEPDYLKVVVYTNKDNINKLKENYSTYKSNDLNNQVNELYNRVNELNELINEKDNEIEGLKNIIGEDDEE